MASLIVLFLLFVFSGLGLSMIGLSQLYLRINAWRKFSVFLDYASENGVKRGFEDLTTWLQSRGRLAAVSGADVDALRTSPAAAFEALIQDGLGGGFPRSLQESADGLTWESVATCALRNALDCGTYFRMTAALRIESGGTMVSLRPRRVSSLDAALGLLAGRLPLPAIPLLIDKEMSEAEKTRLFQDGGLRLTPRPGEIIGPQPAVSGGNAIPKDPTPLIGRALKIHLLAPQDLTDAKLRFALGLPESEEPVPDGVYLMKNDLGIGGVFVQGDCDELIAAINGDAQVLVFRTEAGEWRLEFSPARSRTEFRTPAGSAFYDLVPTATVIVSGKIGSLGGGVIAPDGTVARAVDEETASILSGVDLTIISSDKITLTSHLILQNVRWQNGVPYIKDTQSQVVIYAAGRDFQTGGTRDGSITVDAGAPDGLKLQASLTAGDGGFTIEGSGKSAQIMGALHAGDFIGNGNSLELVSDERIAAGLFPENSPMTSSPMLSVYSLKILSWQEY